MSDTKRQQRTPSEIIAETEAKLAKLRVKQAKQQAQDNPAVASLLDQKADLQKDLREAKKILGAGPQSASARIAKHEAWIERIRESVFEAEATLSSAEQRILELDAQIEQVITDCLSESESESEASA